jgi:hypothetical protein
MRSIPQPADGATRVQRALTWAIFLAAASLVGSVCVAILRPFLGHRLVRRTRDRLLPGARAIGATDWASSPQRVPDERADGAGVCRSIAGAGRHRCQ